MLHRLHIVVLLILSAMISLPFAASAAADAGGPAFLVAPVPDANPAITAKGYFVYQLEPGANARGKLQLTNLSSQPVTVVLDVLDAQTAQTGGTSFGLPGATLTGTATWLKLDALSVTLAVSEARQIGFLLQVPPGTAPRQYLAGIAAHVVATPATAGPTGDAKHLGAGITMQTRQVIGVEADVPGAWQSSLTISNVSLIEQPSGDILGVQMRNDGATFLMPAGTLTISDASGKRMATQALKMSTFVPGTDVTYPVALVTRPASGDYKISVAMAYDTSKVAHYDSTLTVADAAAGGPAAPDSGPLDLGSGQPAAKVPPAAPGTTQSDMTPWLAVGFAGLFILVALAGLVVLVRRRRSA